MYVHTKKAIRIKKELKIIDVHSTFTVKGEMADFWIYSSEKDDFHSSVSNTEILR